jgi:CII-binding regulator of phage lambda lysogenization HflD
MAILNIFHPELKVVLNKLRIHGNKSFKNNNFLSLGITGAREAQIELKEQLTQLESQLAVINQELDKSADLEPYVIKLLESKKKIIVVNSMLQDAQDRLNRVHQNCLQETSKRRTLLEPSSVSKQ